MTTDVHIDASIRDSPFLQSPAETSLRVCCYGSSSSQTPERYLQEARHLGYILAQRGHVCVNGAGSYGCMAAMNDGCAYGNGHIIGVIHEMWLVDSSDWGDNSVRDGGAHAVFQQANGKSKRQQGPIREMLVAGGEDLQERKRLLVDKANALVVLPGGPGTWDELWEMACARNIGLTQIPIVCVNVDGYYDPFRKMLERAYEDQLTKLQPHEIVHFEDTAEKAVQWLEQAQHQHGPTVHLKKRVMHKSSFYSPPITPDTWTRRLSSQLSNISDWVADAADPAIAWIQWAAILGLGVAVGILMSEGRAKLRGP